jgi:nitroimidazol reductase NimA-like FMN-containing flavoprotein (pyridoxamine 5'-phosphate oxidase superfamily)
VDLLRTAPVGRIGFSSGALPTILPVNFLVDGEHLLVLTGRGSKLDAATRNAVVAFEADDIDPTERAGWSVVVTGVAREVPPDEAAAVDLSGLDRWAPGEDGRVIAISLEVVSGRRVVHQ